MSFSSEAQFAIIPNYQHVLMMTETSENYFNPSFWQCKHTWKTSSKNTSWCLVGCAIGDLGTLWAFQTFGWAWHPMQIMALAMINGLITSIMLETIILKLQGMSFWESLKTALGMSLISMIAMELAMNTVDLILSGGTAEIRLSYLPLILFFGFITPLPYNYWRLKALGVACH